MTQSTVSRYAAAYFVVIVALFYVTMKTSRLVHAGLWVYDQSAWLQTMERTRHWGRKLASVMRHLRRRPVCVLVNSNEVSGEIYSCMVLNYLPMFRADQYSVPQASVCQSERGDIFSEACPLLRRGVRHPIRDGG